MYFDLFLPFPIPEPPLETSKKKKDKGKGKAVPPAIPSVPKSCWDGLTGGERDGFAQSLALSGHLGYSVVGLTLSHEPSSHAYPSPFRASLPYPSLDPRHRSSAASSSSNPTLVQVTRYHIRLDDSKTHCLTSANVNTLKEYDILSVQPTSDRALQLACTDLSNPGPNQLSIITLPLHEKPYHFRLNRKQIRQAQRNGIVVSLALPFIPSTSAQSATLTAFARLTETKFEILYSIGLFPPRSVPPDVARRYRQNFMSNAREIIRITGGKAVVFSSGPGGSDEGMRGPIDVINLATVLGMPANLAKEAVSLNPKKVLLRAQARRTFKAVLSMPKMVPPPGIAQGDENDLEVTAPTKRTKQDAEDEDSETKRVRVM